MRTFVELVALSGDLLDALIDRAGAMGGTRSCPSSDVRGFLDRPGSLLEGMRMAR